MYTEYGNPHRKEEGMMATVESNARWKRENTINVSVRLMNKTEMDVIEALNQRDGSMRSRLLELLRLGIEYEKLQREDTAPTPVAETERPKLKNDHGFERTASGLPDLRKVKRWNQEENNEEEKEK